jgi:peptide/nickel transport system ATP-binding protein
MNGERNNEKFLSVKNLSVEYTTEGQVVHAVNAVNFDLESGKTLGLVGETGAGKTTIAKSILRILPEPPARIRSGSIVLDGQDLINLSDNEMYGIRGNKISMIFQDPMTSLNPVQRVGDQISEVIQLHNNITRGESKKQAINMLAMVNITPERYDEYPHQFSGGMKQRVVIAMALACNPKLLLADEPTSALDVTIQAEVLSMIRKLRKEFNTAMILITHDLGVVARICDSVAIIYAGEIVEYGSKEDIFLNHVHPYTVGLFGAIPQLGKRVARLTSIKGLPPDPTNLPSGCHFHPRCPSATDSCSKGVIPNIEIKPDHTCKCLYAAKREAI